MGNVNRIQRGQPVQAPGRVNKTQKQDKPTPGVVYGEVHRSEGDPEETIQAILHFARQKVMEKRGGEKKGGKKKQKKKKGQGQSSGQEQEQSEDESRFDENKTYMIASPVPDTMVQPRKNGCAPTCLAMLLRKYGLAKSVKEGYLQIEALRTADSEVINDVGLSLEDISSYAQQAGLKSRVQRGYAFLDQLEALLRVLNRGATPIASIQLPGMGNMRHAVLIVGVTQHEVTIVDPAKAEMQKLPIVDFQICWQKEDKTQTGVGLAYVEVWGEDARGQVIQSSVSWSNIIEEMYRDRTFFSDIAMGRRDSRFQPVIVQFFDKDE